jgi:hypothetical protein
MLCYYWWWGVPFHMPYVTISLIDAYPESFAISQTIKSAASHNIL